MPSDRAQHIDPAGAASIPPPAVALPPPPPPSSGRTALRAEFIEDVRRIGVKSFREGHAAIVDQLAEPIAATWLASESGLAEGRCRDLLLRLRDILIKANADA